MRLPQAKPGKASQWMELHIALCQGSFQYTRSPSSRISPVQCMSRSGLKDWSIMSLLAYNGGADKNPRQASNAAIVLLHDGSHDDVEPVAGFPLTSPNIANTVNTLTKLISAKKFPAAGHVGMPCSRMRCTKGIRRLHLATSGLEENLA